MERRKGRWTGVTNVGIKIYFFTSTFMKFKNSPPRRNGGTYDATSHRKIQVDNLRPALFCYYSKLSRPAGVELVAEGSFRTFWLDKYKLCQHHGSVSIWLCDQFALSRKDHRQTWNKERLYMGDHYLEYRGNDPCFSNSYWRNIQYNTWTFWNNSFECFCCGLYGLPCGSCIR